MPSLDINKQQVFYTWTDAKSSVTNAQCPVFILIHGLGSSHAFFGPVIPSLSAAGYPCLALDTPGSALSPWNGRDSSIARLANVVAELASSLDIALEKVVVVGHSMGAMIASRLAQDHALMGAVLLGPVHPSPDLADVFQARVKTVDEKGMEAMADVIPSAATGSRCTATQRSFIRALLLSQTKEGYNSLCRTIATAEAPGYAEAMCPLLVIAGSNDKTSPMAGCQEILKW
ncbi:alpha/beta hydrolase fold family protein [Xylariaceae sp. FL0016]|nr:alpha/beta hydrolase fold family protein [Xylariaceae sp. FL0016]